MLVHHTGRDKDKGYRGPTDWWASSDVMFGIKPTRTPGTVRIQPEKCRDGRLLPPFNLGLNWGMKRFSVAFEGETAKEELAGKAKEVCEFIRSRGQVPQSRIFDEVEGARSTLQAAIKKVLHADLAYWTGEKENRSPVIAYRDPDGPDEVPDVTADDNHDAE